MRRFLSGLGAAPSQTVPRPAAPDAKSTGLPASGMSYRLSAPPNPGRGAAGLARFPATPEAAPGCVEARTAGRRRSLGGRHEQPRRGTGGAVRFALEPGPPGLGPPTFDSFDCALAGRGAVIALVPGHRQRPATTRAEGRDADTGDGCMAQTHRWQGSGDGSKSLPRTARALGPAQAGTCRAATARHTATRARTCARSARTRLRARTPGALHRGPRSQTCYSDMEECFAGHCCDRFKKQSAKYPERKTKDA